MAKRVKLPADAKEVIELLTLHYGEWVLVTNTGTSKTVDYLHSIGARTMTEPYAVSPTGELLESVWAMYST